MNSVFLYAKANIYAKKFVDSKIIRIFAPTESATLPIEQRTRAGLFIITTGLADTCKSCVYWDGVFIEVSYFLSVWTSSR